MESRVNFLTEKGTKIELGIVVKEILRIEFFILAFICFCACASETDDSDQGALDDLASSRFQEPRGRCASTDLIGDFKVRLLEDDETRSFIVTGEVRNGVLPSSVPLEVSTIGDCRITKKNNPFCEEMCTMGTVCDNNGGQSEVGYCVDEPLRQDLGNVFVDGLSQPIVMMPDINNSYSDDSLPYPGFSPGSEIKLSAIGANVEGFVLYGKGIEPLLVPNSNWQLIPQHELVVNWTPSTIQNATISATINIDQHGTSSASIRCEAPDTGTLVVPQELINELYSLGTSGFPSGALIRHTVDSVETDLGCIEFEVSSQKTIHVEKDPSTKQI